MAGERLKVIFKYAVFIVIIGFIAQLLASILVGLLGGFVFGLNDFSDTSSLISAIVATVILLPFAYYFSYKAVSEYLSGGAKRGQKNIGISISLSTIF